MRTVPRWMLIVGVLAATVVFVAVAVLAWGPWREFSANPARLGVVVATLLLTVTACFSDINVSSGRREDTTSRWIFVPFALYGALLTWLPPYCDGRDILTLDGDALRDAGLLVFLVGGALRVAPMFVLGPRFSALVAIQAQHELVTDGLYGVIRHQSFLGAGLTILGWSLVFRSGLSLLLTPIAVWLGVARINAEEALLAAAPGDSSRGCTDRYADDKFSKDRVGLCEVAFRAENRAQVDTLARDVAQWGGAILEPPQSH